MNRNETEIEKLKQLFDKAEYKTQLLVSPLLDNAEFMSKELKKLRKQIKSFQNCEGWTDEKGISPEGKAYNSLMKNFNTTIKSLYLMLEDNKTPGGNTNNTTPNAAFNKIRGGKSD